MNKGIVYAVVGLLALLTLRDIYGHSEDEYITDDEAFNKEFGEDEARYPGDADESERKGSTSHDDTSEEFHVRVPSSHFAAPSILRNLPTMKFAFCVSCGYRQAFDDFSRIIHEKYPNMIVEGENYAPLPWKSIIAQVIGIGKIAAIVMIIMERDPFPSIGRPTPAVVSWALNNKISACMMLFLLSNTIESSLMSTGAFEIYMGPEQIWSKLESGRVPSPTELLQIIDQHMELQGVKMSEAFTLDH